MTLKLIYLALASGQDRTTRIWISRPTWNSNNRTDEIHKMVAIKTLSIWNKGQWPLRDRGSRWGEPYNYLSLLLWEFPGYTEIKGIQTELKVLPERADGTGSDEAKEARVHRAECQIKRGLQGKRALEGCRWFPRKHSPERWLVFASEEIFWSQGWKTSESIMREN